MDLTDYQKSILAWLYGLQNYQGIFANVPPPPPGIVPPPVSQAPSGEAWIAYSTTAAEVATDPRTVQEIPGTPANDPQMAISAMPQLVSQIGGTLLLTLEGAKALEAMVRSGELPGLAGDALANIDCRMRVLKAASGKGARPSDSSPRWDTNANLLARSGLIAPRGDGAWQITDAGRAALQSAAPEPITAGG